MIPRQLTAFSQDFVTMMERCVIWHLHYHLQTNNEPYTQAHEAKPSYPSTIAGLSVTAIRDLTVGYDSSNPPSYKPKLPLSSGHMVQFRAENPTEGTKISLTIRTSGTEPKVMSCRIPFYISTVGWNAELSMI